jgi:hypothetical protein
MNRRPSPRRVLSVVPVGRCLAAALLAAAVVAALAVSPPQIPAQDPAADLAAVARAFNTTWNTHDADAVLAFFADTPVIRQASPVLAGYDEYVATVDTYGVAMAVSYARIGGGQDPIVLATGRTDVRQWVEGLFAANHRLETANYQVSGDQVTWTYRAFADPYQQVPHIGPSEGAVSAVLHQGKIVSLTITADPASVRMRQAEVATAVAYGVQQRSIPSAAARSAASPGPWIAAVVLSLLGVVGLAMLKRRPAQP